MIDEKKSKIPVWLTWSTDMRGIVALEHIALVQSYARYARKVLLNKDLYLKVKIEPTLANHMFNMNYDQEWLEMTESASKRVMQEHSEIVNGQMEIAKKLGGKLVKAIGSGDPEKMRVAAQDWVMVFGGLK